MKFYYELFLSVKDIGFLGEFDKYYLLTGKFEPAIVLLYALIPDSIGIYGFLFANFILLLTGMYYSVRKYAKADLAPQLLFLALLSYYSFSEYVYFWRQIFATSLVLIGLSLGPNRKVVTIFFILTGIAFHYFALIVCSIWFLVRYLFAKENKVILKYALLTLFIYFLLSYDLFFLDVFSGNGTLKILKDETGQSIYSKINATFIALILFFFRKQLLDNLSSVVIVDVAIVFCICTIFMKGDQLVMRTFFVASMLAPFLVAYIKSKIKFAILLLSCYTSAGLIFKIIFLGLVVDP